ncbi:hypothetical protein EYF80_007193 [Liparis tanakae]|uniref:Uncharacterized protein n=1 Tax=Liparis tanakae TaxID=230148 RepID=A0A4Z2IXH2_9TELE|nr:hypothetical protein EYF80_007193 [Liparis tanakae]
MLAGKPVISESQAHQVTHYGEASSPAFGHSDRDYFCVVVAVGLEFVQLCEFKSSQRHRAEDHDAARVMDGAN